MDLYYLIEARELTGSTTGYFPSVTRARLIPSSLLHFLAYSGNNVSVLFPWLVIVLQRIA
jgi:hypothetical protein